MSDAQPDIIGGHLRERPADFLVDEQPLYDLDGDGQHLWMFLEKRLLTTPEALERLADAFGVRPTAFAYAGLKDKAAVTRQHVSLDTAAGIDEAAAAEAIERFNADAEAEEAEAPAARVVWADRHRNGVGRGHLSGNRFVVRARGVDPMRSALLAKPIVGRLQSQGLPNFFGPQRFGTKNDNDVHGLTLIRGERLSFRPSPRQIPLYLSAVQSRVFNRLLERRLADGTWLEPLEGERLYHGKPSGPVWGWKMRRASGVADALEVEALSEAGLTPASFEAAPQKLKRHLRGTRRHLRLDVRDLDFSAGVDGHGPFLRVSFELPAGAYATTVMSEILGHAVR